MDDETDKFLEEYANRLEIPLKGKKVYKWKIQLKPSEKILSDLDDKKKSTIQKLFDSEVMFNWIFFSRNAERCGYSEDIINWLFDNASEKIIEIREKQLKLI